MNNVAGIFQTAQATDCAPPSPSQKYTGIKIVSKNAFVTNSRTYNAGETLNEIFTLYDSGGISVEESLINNFTFENGILIVLKTPPSAAQQHQLSFTISLDDGSEFTATSETITILP
jgi:hypothetical protein